MRSAKGASPLRKLMTVCAPEIRRNQAPFSAPGWKRWATMCRYLALFFLTLALTLPAHAKDATKTDKTTGKATGASSKGNFALGVDQITGGCEVRKIGAEAEDPLGFKLLGTYDKENMAKSAQTAFPACKNGPAQDEKRASLEETEKACQTDAHKESNSLVGLFSGLASSASQETRYFDCMKANGYDAKR
jgi:hypothetical protein